MNSFLAARPATPHGVQSIRTAFIAAVAVGALALAMPALSSEGTAKAGPDNPAAVRLAPPLVPTTVTATPVRAAPDSCAVILRRTVPVGGNAVSAHRPYNVMPAAIIGMAMGVNHVTGPRERATAFLPDDAVASLDGRNARTIALYRQCRSEAALRTMSMNTLSN